MSIIDTLITDRTQADVNRVLTLSAKGWAAMTAAEREEFEAGMKGSYNATDLNRVNAAMEYLDTRLKAMGYTGGYYQRVKVPHQQSGGGSVLPEGYTQVEYIQSSGTQYVDTGFKPNQDTRVVMDFELLSVTGQYADPIFGVRTSASSNGYYFWATGTSGADQYQSGYNNGSTYPAVTRVGRHTVDKNKNVTTVDGVTTEAAYAAFTTAWNMLLFQSYNNGNLYSQTTKMRLYSCQTYDNDALIRDYLPCIDPSGEAGLYDIVNGAFYGNDGTGAFVAGPPVNPKLPDGYKRLKYIQANGTQFVDTGFKPNQNTAVYMHAKMVEASSYPSLFGARNNTSQMYWLYHNNGNSTPSDAFIVRVNATSHNVSAPFGDEQLFFITNDQGGVGDDTVSFDSGTFQSSYNMYLFGVNNRNALQYPADMQLMDCMIYDGNTFIRNYVPCETPDGDIGLYDLVTNEFYGNAGTGAFIAGPEVTATITPSEPEEELDPYTWYKEDIPTPEALEAYLDNVRRFRSAKPLFATTPQVPEDMVLATIEEWNDIEQILVDIETSLISIAKAAIYAGTPYIFAGGPMIYATGG